MQRRENLRTSGPRRRGWPTLLAGLAGLFLLTGIGPCRPPLDPIIFVHGGSGSGAQFETQAMRFTSNGYPQDFVAVVEYDSNLSFPEELPVVFDAIDARIAELQARTGRDQVTLMGHSRGTTVSHAYLEDPQRAARVGHYVNIDGRSSDALPGGVPTLALWAGAVNRPVQGEIVGAVNVTVPDQEHIEVATSAEAFVEMFQFLHDRPPFTTDIRPQILPSVAGRVTAFPENMGLDGATLEVWRVRGATGERIGRRPRAVYEIGPDGDFGPFRVVNGQYFEFAVSREEDDVSVRYFYEPFVRSDHLVRLNVALDLADFIDASPDHTAVTALRFKEFWGDRGIDNDVLSFDGVDVINPVTAPSGAVGVASSAFFVFDDDSDGLSDLESVPFPFPFLAFLTATDLFLPSDPPGHIAIETVPRGKFDAARTLNIPNIPSSEARLVVQLRDFE
jgi:pimeloyl-ACP methyl ester carboxylesterase